MGQPDFQASPTIADRSVTVTKLNGAACSGNSAAYTFTPDPPDRPAVPGRREHGIKAAGLTGSAAARLSRPAPGSARRCMSDQRDRLPAAGATTGPGARARA